MLTKVLKNSFLDLILFVVFFSILKSQIAPMFWDVGVHLERLDISSIVDQVLSVTRQFGMS